MLNNLYIYYLKLFNKKKTYEFIPYVYLDMFNNPTKNKSFKIKELKTIKIDSYSKEDAFNTALKEITNNYPQIKEIINIKYI